MAEPSDVAVNKEELAAIIREIRERVRERYPEGGGAGASLPDLMPVLHARDAAQGKVASIGMVNPRPGGAVNTLIQFVKRMISRALDWHVRDQVEFNRAVVSAVDAILETLNENNRILAGHVYVRDLPARWAEWHTGWEKRLDQTESRLLRSVAELQAAFQHRTLLLESNLRELISTREELTGHHIKDAVAPELDALQRSFWASGETLQKRMWSDLERMRADLERTIHSEIRLIRQRAALEPPVVAPVVPEAASVPTAPIDFVAFANRFRGSEEYVRERQRFYLPFFEGCRNVLDAGCGRGEFLELMREAGIRARGIDLGPESIALCRSKDLDVLQGDVFTYLAGLEDGTLDGFFSAQVVEHVPPASLPALIGLAAAKLRRGGVLAIETPNPECLAIFASHFYLDPTHERPVPAPLLAFYLEEAGMSGIQVHRLSPAAETMPALNSLPEDFRQAFFGGLDYAITARKP